jgi:hypothetical protein
MIALVKMTSWDKEVFAEGGVFAPDEVMQLFVVSLRICSVMVFGNESASCHW